MALPRWGRGLAHNTLLPFFPHYLYPIRSPLFNTLRHFAPPLPTFICIFLETFLESFLAGSTSVLNQSVYHICDHAGDE
jgi:hypothetical protein